MAFVSSEIMESRVEDKIYVAVGKDLKKSQSTLNWALHNSGSKQICIFHVHKPAEKIPFMATYFRLNQLDVQQVTAYQEIEKQDMLQILEKYNQICQKSGVRVEVKYIEMDSIEKGIVEFILQHNVKNLVMGAAADKQFSRRMVQPRSKKAIYVRLHAAASCQIHFICKGNIIFIRRGSRLDEPNAFAYSEESSLRSSSVREEQNTRLHPSNPTQEYHLAMSNKHHETGKTTSIPNFDSDSTLSFGLKHPTSSSEAVDDSGVMSYEISEGKSKNPNRPVLMKLLYSNQDLTEFQVTFFENIPALQVLDLSSTSIKCLPSSISNLTFLEELFLRICDLMMELPPEIGALTNLKVFDSEGTQLICLPEQFGSLTKMECLTFSLYNFADKYKRRICADLSNLTLLKELSICLDSYGEWWEDEVKLIIDILSKFRNLESLKLYFPTTKLLNIFMEKQNSEGVYIYQHLLNFSFIVGRLQQRLISRIPHDLEKVFVKLPKFVKYTNGEGDIEVFAKALRHANSLILDRHWTIPSLSTFGLEEMENLKFCMLGECNELLEIINGRHLANSSLKRVLGSLEYLSVYYMKSLSCIWNGPIHNGCLTNLKTLRIHSCPKLTTIFTQVLPDNLKRLEYLIIEDCEKIKTLISLESNHSKSTSLLPKLKKITLLHNVELVSISDGISIAPRLESLVVYNCPNLKKLPFTNGSNHIREIKGEYEWWDALKWNEPEWTNGRPGYLARVFTPLGTNGDIMDELDDAINVFPHLSEVVQFKENIQNPPAYRVMEERDMYDQFEQAMAEAENSKRDAFEESIRRRKAEKDATEAKRRAKASENLYAEEFRRRRESDEILEKTKAEHEIIKKDLDEVSEELRTAREHKSFLESQIADSDLVVHELEQKMFSAVELLQNYKKERDEALNLVEEMREKQAKEATGSSVSQLYTEFSFSEVQEATRNFHPSLKIREGSNGSIFRGFLRHTEVATKKLHSKSLQGPSEFQHEVNVLSKVRHPNLVTLVGVCSDASIIIYEYLSGGNLEDRLACKDNTPPLSWQNRIRIAVELCSVLIFLHSCGIVHCDLKPTNLLLDENLVTKLSDFGISCELPKNEFTIANTFPSLRTDPKGTFEYMDPEFISTGELTLKSDTYSFGIILLRLLTGRPALGLSKEVQYALNKKNLKNILDPTAGDWPLVQAQELARLAMNCCDVVRKNRPDLGSEAWKVLEPMRATSRPSLFKFGFKGKSQIPHYFICPISQEIMQDPVVAADGFTYEAEAYRRWLDSGHNTSPLTNLELANSTFFPNHVLRSAIQEWLQQP